MACARAVLSTRRISCACRREQHKFLRHDTRLGPKRWCLPRLLTSANLVCCTQCICLETHILHAAQGEHCSIACIPSSTPVLACTRVHDAAYLIHRVASQAQQVLSTCRIAGCHAARPRGKSEILYHSITGLWLWDTGQLFTVARRSHGPKANATSGQETGASSHLSGCFSETTPNLVPCSRCQTL